MTWKTWLASLAVALTAALLVFFSRPISEFIVSAFFPHLEKKENPVAPQAAPRVLAVVTEVEGAASRRPSGDTEFSKLKKDSEVFTLDQIKLEQDAQARLHFTSGWELQLMPNTTVTLELYRPGQTESPVLLTFTRGDYQLRGTGSEDQLFIAKDGVVFTPLAKPIPVDKLLDMNLAPDSQDVTPLPDTAPAMPAVPTPSPPPAPVATRPGRLPEKHLESATLSSAEINEVLLKESESLRRCQLNSLRDDMRSEGSLLMSFTIQTSGRLERIKVLQDSVHNPRLLACVSSILERMKFRAFEGLPITMTYPIEFK